MIIHRKPYTIRTAFRVLDGSIIAKPAGSRTKYENDTNHTMCSNKPITVVWLKEGNVVVDPTVFDYHAKRGIGSLCQNCFLRGELQDFAEVDLGGLPEPPATSSA